AIERSRFPQFLAALDETLAVRTGRARLLRAAEESETAASDECALLDREIELLGLDAVDLDARRSTIVPQLARLDERARTQRDALLEAGRVRLRQVEERGQTLADDLQRAL